MKIALGRVLPHVPPRRMSPRARLIDDLGIDSLKVAELSLALEEAFDRPIFLGEILAGVEDPTTFTLGELAEWLGRTER